MMTAAERSKEWRRNNPEKRKIYADKRYSENKEELRASSRKAKDRIRFGGMREIVFKRDDWRCQGCGMSQEQHFIIFNCSLSIDHIDGDGRNSDSPNNNLDNLITLCLRCHAFKENKKIAIDRWGELIEQDETEWKYPKIRKLVQEARKKTRSIQEAKGVVAKEMKVSFHTIDTKYYQRKVRLSEEKRNG